MSKSPPEHAWKYSVFSGLSSVELTTEQANSAMDAMSVGLIMIWIEVKRWALAVGGPC